MLGLHGIIDLPFHTVDCSEMHPQGNMGLHGHNFGELVFIKSGKAIHFTQFQEYTISSHDIFYIKKGVYHGFKNCEDLHLINIFFHHDLLANNLLDLQSNCGYQALFELESESKQKLKEQKHLKLNGEDWQILMNNYSDLKNEISEKKESHDLMSKSLLIQMIIMCSRFYNERLSDSQEKPLNAAINSLSKVISYIEANYKNKIYTEDLASVANTSLSTLQRHFKSVNMSNLSDHINKVRIRNACILLHNSKKSITDIAYSVGYEDGNYFSKVFKKMMGVSPKHYKKGHKQII
jgi:AraC-like DNA-binding protein